MNTTTSTAVDQTAFDAGLRKFLIDVNAFIAAYYARELSKTPASSIPQVSADPNGQKFIRIVSRTPGAEHGSAFCFVERATGNVLKCDGFKRPAKGARGNIFAIEFSGYGVNEHGANYANRR